MVAGWFREDARGRVRKRGAEKTREPPAHASGTAKELVGGNSGDQKLRRRGAIDARDKYALPRATHGIERRQRHRRRREDRGGGDQPNTANGRVKELLAGRKHTYRGS